jgi:uncharacterized membrane protein
MKNYLRKIKLWYTGYLDIDSTLQDPDASEAYLRMTIHNESHLKYFIHVICVFWRAEWKWIIGTVLTITGLIIAVFAI